MKCWDMSECERRRKRERQTRAWRKRKKDEKTVREYEKV